MSDNMCWFMSVNWWYETDDHTQSASSELAKSEWISLLVAGISIIIQSFVSCQR